MSRYLRPLLWLALSLALLIVLASITLRLSANGIGCTPWPACYGQAETANAAQATVLAQTLRLAHRVSASSFVLVVLAAVLLGWRHWSRTLRGAAGLLLLVTALLASIGRYTPSPLPLVTLINVMGGLSLLLLLAWLLAGSSLASRAAPPRTTFLARFARNVGILLLLGLAWQAASGAFISVRLAGAACTQGCEQAWLPGTLALLDPLRTGTAQALHPHPGAAQPLHLLHRLFGLGLLVIAWGAALAWPIRGTRAPRLTARVLTGTLLTGVLAATFDGALSAVVLHALLAGMAVVGVGVMLGGEG